MNKEIKEILDDLRKYANEGGEHKLMEYELKHIQCYITNLEQEVQDLKADYGSKSQVERDLLEQENERLKDNLETMTFTAKVKQEAVDSLISRIDKAKEELENIGDFYTTPIGQVIHLEDKIKHINKSLNILKGVNKND